MLRFQRLGWQPFTITTSVTGRRLMFEIQQEKGNDDCI